MVLRPLRPVVLPTAPARVYDAWLAELDAALGAPEQTEQGLPGNALFLWYPGLRAAPFGCGDPATPSRPGRALGLDPQNIALEPGTT
jgi:hypothetical protein